MPATIGRDVSCRFAALYVSEQALPLRLQHYLTLAERNASHSDPHASF
jgi:hypothetical protein